MTDHSVVADAVITTGPITGSSKVYRKIANRGNRVYLPLENSVP